TTAAPISTRGGSRRPARWPRRSMPSGRRARCWSSPAARASGPAGWPPPRRVTAVDASAEMLAINRARVSSPAVSYIEADAFAGEPPVSAFDVVFFSFWLSHVPPKRFDAFWALVRRSLRPGGRFFLIDSRHEPTATAADDRLPERTATT